MRHLGIKLIFTLSYFNTYAQCGGYLDNRHLADSCFKAKKYVDASHYYIKCLEHNERKRSDYYYTSYSLIKCDFIDSALYYFKLASQKGLHYSSVEEMKKDSIVQNLLAYNDDWKKVIDIVTTNTINFVKHSNIDTTLLSKLRAIKKTDQKYRGLQLDSFPSNKRDSIWDIQKNTDLENQEWLKKQLKQSGWPIISEVGAEGDRIAWLIVQHSDNDTLFQRTCLTLLLNLVKEEETNLNNIAYLEDRLLINSNKEQIYGTQFETIFENGKIVNLELKPTKEIECLDKRRAYMNLQPIADYLDSAKKRYIRN